MSAEQGVDRGPDSGLEPLFHQFIEINPAIFWTADEEGHVTIAGEAGAKRLGVPQRFGQADAHLEIFHPDDRRAAAPMIRAARADGSLFDTECRLRVADGTYRWMRLRARFDAMKRRWHGAVQDIHDQREAEAALRIANERLALALDANKAWAWDYDIRAGRFWFSDRWQTLLGYDKNEISYDMSDLVALVHPDDQAALYQAGRAHLAGHSPALEVDYRIRHKSGSWIWVHDRGRVTERDAAGRPLRALGTRTDITERKAIEAQAQASEAYLKTLLDNITDAVIAVGPDGKRGFYNKAYAKLFLEHDMDWGDLTQLFAEFEVRSAAGEIFSDHDRPIARILRGETIKELEVTAVAHATGRSYRLIYNGQPVFSADGAIELAVLTIRDITERKLADDRLRDSEARLAAILESLDEGVVAFAPGEPDRGFANTAFRKLFGPSDPQQPIFATLEEACRSFDLIDANGHVLTPDERPLRRVLSGERIEGLDLRARFTNAREIDVVCSGEPLLDPEGSVKLAVLAVRDVTQQRRAEAELATLQQELIHVSRVSAMGTMAGSLAHELNQPLAAIVNFTAAARMMLDSPSAQVEQARESMRRVADEAFRAGQIIGRLRRFITKGEVERQPVSLTAIVREALGLAHSDASARATSIKLKLDIACDVVLADRIQLQQVIFNVVRNAVEAMEDQADGEITIASRHSDGMVELLIADRGPGLAPEVATHLFEPFVTTKETGMGIGLPICRSIMNAHGGNIRAEARPTGGTVFILSLPPAAIGIAAE